MRNFLKGLLLAVFSETLSPRFSAALHVGLVHQRAVLCAVQLTGLNRTWGSAYLSARRTYRLGVLSAGRKYGLIRHPPLVLAEKMAGGTAVPSAGRLGQPKVRPANRPAESTAVPLAGLVGRPKVRPYLRPAESAGRRYGLIRHPPL